MIASIRSIILIVAAASWLPPSAIAVVALAPRQRIQVDEPTPFGMHRIEVDEPPLDPFYTDGNTRVGEGDTIPDEAMIEQVVPTSTPQATINSTDVDTNPFSEPAAEQGEVSVPIFAKLFAGSPGPKDCRGAVIAHIPLSKPGSAHTTPRCYNMPGVAQCGYFVGNQDDGCAANLFNEPNCHTFTNLAVFTPELRAQGGFIRSIEIRCGVESVAPPPLNLPGMNLLSGEAQQAVG
ncbi:hypothetical protein GGR56DRAFT_147395 [Xylariaceae sp. FL0804]|nr:hypothetical protein GGR56DRAFT_147395 [Xylariaceae sp. FL0804]